MRSFFLDAAHRFVLPPALLVAIAKVESGFNPDAVGVPTPYGRALGMMQFLPSSWRIFNVTPGADEFDPHAAVLAAAHHLQTSGHLVNGGWDAAQAVFGYNHSTDYVRTVLAWAKQYGYAYNPQQPPADPVRYRYPVIPLSTATVSGSDQAHWRASGPLTVRACVRSTVLAVTTPGNTPSVLVVRGEDGWLYHYRGLTQVAQAARVSAVIEAGGRLGIVEGGPRRLATVTFTMTRGDALNRAIDPTPFLRVWRDRG
jgi:hypothetical protein